ncbi:MAG: hypothetical protein OEY06_09935 [Gammaproteobacteria bacterium]|nr:hypothetical protein [Gammaproteobacteria bacterium]
MSIEHHLSFSRTAIATLLAAILSAGTVGCSNDAGVASTTIDGSVFASAVDGAACSVQDINGNIIVDNIGTSATGTYSANIPTANLADDLVLVCDGGTYTNEADGTSQTAGMLAAYANGGTLAAGVALHATPDSTIMYQLRMQHQMTHADAEAAFSSAFGYTPDTTIAPTDATAPATGASNDELLAGLHAATFSQLALDLGLTAAEQFDLMLALAEDLSDGTLDGSNTTGIALSANIQNQFTLAMMNFRDGGNDASGLAADMIGVLPFAQTALTANYTVEYLKDTMGMMEMDAMEGKSQFQIRVTDSVGAPVSDTVSIMPMMHMADKTHSTPVDNAGACIPSATPGTYDCTVYYVMASVMMDGTSMGYWDLAVMVGGMADTAHFFPPVMMAMNGTAMVKLKNSNLTMMSMDGPVARTFQVFKSSLISVPGSHTFELFTSTMETMMSFPAVFDGVSLNEAALIIANMAVEVSTDAAFTSPILANQDGSGYWTAEGITGLTNGVEGTLYVRIATNTYTLNSSIDGVAGAGINDYATFTVTPGAM